MSTDTNKNKTQTDVAQPKDDRERETEEETAASDADVHSANSWETADLGDKSRNDKFLRLLGAKKKEHHGRFVIGDQDLKHSRPKGEERHMVEELEDQYKHSMEHRLVGGRKGHIGLGFHDDEKVAESADGEKEDGDSDSKTKDENGDKNKDNTDNGEKTEEEKGDNETDGDRKRDSDKSECEHSESKKMKFVSSSS